MATTILGKITVENKSINKIFLKKHESEKQSGKKNKCLFSKCSSNTQIIHSQMSRLSFLIIFFLIGLHINCIAGFCSCKSNNKCNSDCSYYGTKNQACSSTSDCKKQCSCSNNICSSYCNSTSPKYGKVCALSTC